MHNKKPSTMAEYVEKQYRGKGKDEKYRLMMDVAHEADADIRMIGILFADTRRAMEESIVILGDQYKYRTVVRTLFAHIEGELSIKKRQVILWYQIGGMSLTVNERRKLIDEPTIFPSVSPLPLKPKRQTLQRNFLFTFAKFRRLPGIPELDIDTSSEGWKAFLDAIAIRNNFMHPKRENDLIVTPDGMTQVVRAWNWYSDISMRFSKTG